VMMVMLMITVLGIAAITVSGLENNFAGLQRTTEGAAQAAESCLGTSANVIMQTLLPENGSTIPTSLLDSQSPPGPVPSGNKTVLENEIIGNPENNTDFPTGTGAVPNIVMPTSTLTLGGYAVNGDIDRLYVKLRAGTGQQQFGGYEGIGGGGAGAGSDVYYKITCVAQNTATGTESRVSAIYACSLTGDGCQKQP
jgi:Tfp pilus assembly protein PilX